MASNSLLFLSLFLFIHFSSTGGVQLLMVNNCKDTVWPGLLGTAGYPTPLAGGFRLSSGEHHWINVHEKWSGRIWGRKGCSFDSITGKGRCDTGDCAGLLECNGVAGVPPATIVEMTLGTSNDSLHYYDVSLVDGFNLPVSMVPLVHGGGDRDCGVAACERDLNVICPFSLAVKGETEVVVGCKSTCFATGSARLCCTGKFATSENCRPTTLDRMFKNMCPRAYSYAFDERTGLKTCRAPRYVITFCPPI